MIKDASNYYRTLDYHHKIISIFIPIADSEKVAQIVLKSIICIGFLY